MGRRIDPLRKAGEPIMRFSGKAMWAALSIAGLMSIAAVRAQGLPDLNAANAAFVSYGACFQSFYNEPQAAEIAKYQGNLDELSLEQITDPNIATDAEIAALYAMHAKKTSCYKEMTDKLTNVAPTVIPILAEAKSQADTALVELVQKKIAWGVFMTRNRDINLDRTKKLQGEFDRISFALAKTNQDAQRASEEKENRWWEALGQFGQSLQNQSPPPYRPQITNCNRFYNNVTCTTQ